MPISFLSAENSKDIRNEFFSRFKIIKLHIFKNRVFDDTSYNVISFYYKKRRSSDSDIIDAIVFPEKKKLTIKLEKKHNWQFGGDFLENISKVQNKLGIKRLTEDLLDKGSEEVMLAIQNPKYKVKLGLSIETKKLIEKNIIILKAIDSKNGEKIKLDDIRRYDIRGIVGKNTSRNIAHLIFDRNLPIKDQENLIEKFNLTLNEARKKYSSLFLTNFRDNGRKRISFDFSYKFLNYIYSQENR